MNQTIEEPTKPKYTQKTMKTTTSKQRPNNQDSLWKYAAAIAKQKPDPERWHGCCYEKDLKNFYD